MAVLMRGKSARLAAVMLGASLMLTACTAEIRNHGYMPEAAEVAQIELGRDTRESVVEKLGPPTMGGMIADGGLYYVSYSMRHYGVFAPKEIKREILALTFDSNGIIRNEERFGLEDGRVVSLSRRVTDDNVRDNTMLRQLLGSLGRLNASQIFGSD